MMGRRTRAPSSASQAISFSAERPSASARRLGATSCSAPASLLRQRAQLGGGERLLDQIAFLDGQLPSREKLPRLHAAGSAGFAIETDHGRECT